MAETTAESFHIGLGLCLGPRLCRLAPGGSIFPACATPGLLEIEVVCGQQGRTFGERRCYINDTFTTDVSVALVPGISHLGRQIQPERL